MRTMQLFEQSPGARFTEHLMKILGLRCLVKGTPAASVKLVKIRDKEKQGNIFENFLSNIYLIFFV